MKWITRRRPVVIPLILCFVLLSLTGSLAWEAPHVAETAAQVTMGGPPPPQPSGQSPPSTPTPAATAPDVKAYNDANRLTDPDKKIEAMSQFIKDFPNSQRKTAAHQAIFDTMVKSRPGDRDRILEHANAIIAAATEGFRGSSYSRVATRLVDANVMLEDAEKFAVDGLKVFDEEESKRMQRARATHLATIGRIRIKQGRMTEAEDALKEAFAANPDIPGAAVGLAELAETKGDNSTALEYWTKAYLTGRLSADDRGRFETLYTKAHGSLDTFDATIDAKYKEAFPPPIHPEPYKPTAKRTDRTVLAEIFTGAGCPPCVSVDLAFDAVLERYPRKDVAVLMHHMHIPAPDPLTNKSSDGRGRWYGVSGVPNLAVDGLLAGGGGGGRENTKASYDRITPRLEEALETTAGGALTAEATLDGGTVRVKATPSNLESTGETLKLHVALVEDMLTYSGENGIRFHPMVVRSMAGEDGGGFEVKRESPAAVEATFDLAKIAEETKAYLDDYEINGRHGKITFSKKPVTMNPSNLSVVVFLQEDKSRKVLQTTYIKLGPATTTTAGGR